MTSEPEIDGLILSTVKEAEKEANEIVDLLKNDQWDKELIVVRRDRLERIQMTLRSLASMMEILREQAVDAKDTMDQITVKLDQAKGHA